MMETQKKTNNKNKSKGIYFTIDVDTIRYNELFYSISDRELALILALFSFSNKNNECFPTIKKLAKILNRTTEAVQSILRDLKQKEFKGKKILTISKDRLGHHKHLHNKYKLSEDLGINIFKNRVKNEALRKIEVRNLPIKNTHNTKEDTFIKEEQHRLPFSDKKIVDKSQPVSLQELIGNRPKINHIVKQLKATHHNYTHAKAVNLVRYHINKLTEANWNILYDEFSKTGDIKFYHQVTYKVLKENMDIEDAIKLSRKEVRI